ncbi:hypothetical protein G7054_g8446 [Neopestalotiopsis clavispora]|nr:hypothetical protein G7054_g8446 [Neopestalotiopsis clavispora]
MRLIDTKTHLLLEPWKAAGKEYAILSHTWGDQEVIFQEWEQLYPSGAIKGQCPHVRHQGIDQKAGYFKVMKACEQAQRDGFRYLWCDTMCINKESSAELSEAINSMLLNSKWYRDAKVCYVYLSDVTFHNNKFRNIGGPSFCTPNHSNVSGWFKQVTARGLHSDVNEMKSRFMASRWWTRGWTLQELLAPKKVAFFMQDWGLLGHKSDLADLISASTRIHWNALEDPDTIRNFSIAQRMSWAAERQTTVVEDMAYCLLGIFDINMPMLYGQGEGAFQKLQHEIIKTSGDQSIFAWAAVSGDPTGRTGALAKSPRFFRGCGSIVRDSLSKEEPYSLTNIGFKLRVSMIKNDSEAMFFIGLGCLLELNAETPQEGSLNNRKQAQVWIPVHEQPYGDSYVRIHSPTSQVYFQHSYRSHHVIENVEIFLLESPPQHSFGQIQRIAGTNGIERTGIAVAVGFGNMSIISRAYKDVWRPQRFRIIPIGYRGPQRSSHEIIVSGSYCVMLSVAWDGCNKPQRHIHTTLYRTDTQILDRLIDHLNQIDSANSNASSLDDLHEHVRSSNYEAFSAGQRPGAPMVAAEDAPLCDLRRFAFVVVDIIFQEKPTSIRDAH